MTRSKDARSIWEGAGGRGGVWRSCTLTEQEQDVLLGGFGHVTSSFSTKYSTKNKQKTRLESQIPRPGISPPDPQPPIFFFFFLINHLI